VGEVTEKASTRIDLNPARQSECACFVRFDQFVRFFQ